jgi:GDPmannose 4,6-dehydratase
VKRALITGITGQDGSYLAEFLLGKGYEVHGIVRRSSSINRDRIDHLTSWLGHTGGDLRLYYGDLNDSSSLNRIIRNVRPDEIYNLGAQSHVKVSFEVPEYTAEITGVGAVRLLEAIRELELRPRIYQASSSEVFGKAVETPQSERTPFHPRSPYAVAKVFAHWSMVNYREAYGLFAVNGILFNHECVTAETPLLIRRNGLLDIVPIEEIVPHRSHARHGLRYTTVPSGSLEVWDRTGWARVRLMTATWNDPERGDFKAVRRIAARGACFAATHDHVAYLAGCRPSPVGAIEAGAFLELAELPPAADSIEMPIDEAWLLGAMAAEGHVAERKARFSSCDSALIERVQDIWRKLTGGATSSRIGRSGFERGRPAVQLDLTGSPAYCDWLRTQLYTRRGHKRIPFRILNSAPSLRFAFLEGYNAGDGLAAGPGAYLFQSFKTNSAILAQGLWWLARVTLSQRTILCIEEREGRLYYQINLNSPNTIGQKGAHLRLPLEQVVRVTEVREAGWLFDLETATGTFQAGVGSGWIHNSPRRGETFVSRKITRAAGRMRHGSQERLYLGNLEARRDWGFAKDYVEAMWLMLQQPEPDDYVIATGETHSVRELCERAIRRAGFALEWKGQGLDEVGVERGTGRVLVAIDPGYLRPSEVDSLEGDSSKARERLGWSPRIDFDGLVDMMVDADLKTAAREALAAPD